MFMAKAILIAVKCLSATYPVLASVSRSYPGHMGRLPTCYSPVRHGIATIRLACIRHAASVNPEPGSNSPKKFIFCLFLIFFAQFFKRIYCSFLYVSFVIYSFQRLISHGSISRALILYYTHFLMSTIILSS